MDRLSTPNMRVFVISLILICTCTGQTLISQTCSTVRSSVDIEMTGANAVIGGLFEMRTAILGGYACGEPHKELIQVYEAARWAINRVNANIAIPGVKLGMKAYDTCSSEVLALKYAQDFYSRLTSGQQSCSAGSNVLNLGFLGPLSSWTTSAVAEMTAKLPASVLSPRAMSTTLSDSMKYTYFLRTSPSSRAQAKAILDVLKQLQWERVVTVYTDSIYGNSGYEALVKEAMNGGICISKSIPLSGGGSTSDIQTKLANLADSETTIAVFFGSYVVAKQLFEAVHNIGLSNSKIRNIQWIVSDMNTMLETYADVAHGVLTVMPRTTMVTEFREYFINLNEASTPPENPWLADWYMTQYQCKLPGVTYQPYAGYPDCVTLTTDQKRDNFRQNAFVDRTIMAVYAYGKALQKAHQDRCGSTSGVCQSLQQMTTSQFHQYLKDVDFQFNAADGVGSLNGKRVAFDANGDFIAEDFTVWNYNNKSSTFQFHEVGRYESGQLVLSTNDIILYGNDRTNALNTPLPVSKCPVSGCGYCVVPRDAVDFRYIPGDIVIGGILSGHYKGKETLMCGSVSRYGMSEAVAMYYAIQTAKTKYPGILNGVSLGALIADICESPHTGAMLLNNILAELQVVRDSSDRIVDPKAIRVILDFLSSSDAMQFTKGITAFNIQELGIVATSSKLSDKSIYPNFARVLPSDDKQAIAMIQFFAKNGWNFIQTVNSPSEYARSALVDIRKASVSGKVCIGDSYEISDDNSISDILSKIREQPQARVVVLLLDYRHKLELLQALKAKAWPKDYVFVGTDDWYTQLFNGYQEFAPGFISIQPRQFSLTEFESWLGQLKPRQSSNVFGFSEWYEAVFQCYIDSSNRGRYTTECGSSSLTSAAGYIPYKSLSYTINAVYLAANALDRVLKSVCGSNYHGVCSQFRSSASTQGSIKEIFRNISIATDLNDVFKVFEMESQQAIDIFNYQSSGFVQIERFDTIQGRLTNQFNTPIQYPAGLSTGNFKSMCEGVCSQCLYVKNTGSYAHVTGDVEIGGVLAIHDASQSDPFVCGDLRSVNGFQFAAAMMYAVDQVNSKMSPVDLRDVKLGTFILDHCNVESRRFDVLSAFYSGLLSVTDGDQIEVSKVRAWITDNTRSVIEANEVVKSLNIPLLSPVATSNSLMNKDNYPTFFRTIQGDVALSVAMAKLAKALNFRYVTVLYSDEEYGVGGLETFTAVANQEKMCIKFSHKIGSNTSMTSILQSVVSSTVHVVILWTNGVDTHRFYQERSKVTGANNIVVIAPMPFMAVAQSVGTNGGKSFFLNIKTAVIDKYMEYIRSLPQTSAITSNPFVMEYYMKTLGCDLPGFYKYGVECSKIQTVAAWSAAITQDNYVIPTINAVYSFAAALDVTLKDRCGANYRTVCNNFTTTDNINKVIMEKMEAISFKDPSDFTFRYMEREGNTGMDLVYFDGSSLKTVGEFAGASLQISDKSIVSLFPGTQSYCVAPCIECLQSQLEFSYIPGDILIGGVFDVHDKDVTTFSCGDIKRLHGFQLLEAFHYAISKVNDKSGPFGNILKDIKLGGVGLDACDSTIKAGYTVSDIHNGLIKLNKNGETIDPDDISAYIAGYSSDSSIYLARILKSLKIPQISYASTSIALSDQDKYPYFMRSVPSDDKLAESMIRFLDNFDIRYVQVVYSPTNYGRLGSKAFENLARDSKICIGQMIQFPDNGTATRESANEVVSLMLKKPTANTVVFIAGTGYVNALFQAIRRNPSAVGKFHFLGTETWGNNLDILSGVEDLAKSAVTWSLESTDIGDFDTYLGMKSPGNYPQNPWFPQFYEDMVDCYLTVPDGRHPVQCASLSEVVISQRNYIQDPGILHVINSVYAAAIGIDSALRSVCGEDYSTVCEKFVNDGNRRDILMANILKSSFTDPTGTKFSFTTGRDGNKGYQMHSLSTRMEGNKLAYYYKKIGTYSSDKVLSVSNYAPTWDGSCSRADACSECPTLRSTTQRYMYSQSPINDVNAATLIALLPIHAQGSDPYRCGSLNMGDFYRGLSFFFTIRQLTNTPFGLHGVLLDTCTNSLRIDQDLYNLLSSGQLCNSQSDFGNYIINNSTIGGVVTSISTNVMAANRVLAPMKIPLVGSLSSSVALSNKEEYPYFARTVPPDNSQMRVMAEILRLRNWTYVSVVYSRETYGVSGADELEKQTKLNGVCIGQSLGISYPTDDTEARSVVEQLIALQGSNVVVLITLEPRPILMAANALGVLDKFVWIGTDIWGRSQSVVHGIEHPLIGAITIGLRHTSVTGFESYLTDLTYTNRKDIPDGWFEEFYQSFHKCQLADAQIRYSQYPLCTKTETITKDKLDVDHHVIYTTVAATYAAANAIEQTRRTMCAGVSTFRECLERAGNRELLFQKLLQTQFSVATNFTLNFNSERFWDVGYTINNYVMDANGNHFYQEVGSVFGGGSVSLSSYDSAKEDGFTSQCPVGGFCNCDPTVFHFQPPQRQTSNETLQEKMPRNYLYYDKISLPGGQMEYKKHYNWPVWAIATAVPTCVGLLLGIFVFVYFLVAYPIRGGTTVLGFMMIIGILGIYGVNFAFFVPASEATCGARRFMMGVVYAIVFAAMLVKTIDNWRFIGSDFDVRKYSGVTSTCSLFMCAIGILSIQLIIPIEWVILEHPSASLQSDNMIHDWMWCNPVERYDYALVLSMIFVMFLVLLTAIFSALAWDSESNYYESRWIFVSCICTAGCFLVWMVVSTNAGPPFRDPAVAIGNFVNATALLICMPIRKLVLLFYFQRQEEKDNLRMEEVMEDRGDTYSNLYSNPGYEHEMFQQEPMKPGSDIGF